MCQLIFILLQVLSLELQLFACVAGILWSIGHFLTSLYLTKEGTEITVSCKNQVETRVARQCSYDSALCFGGGKTHLSARFSLSVVV